jgi:hypothetical protein
MGDRTETCGNPAFISLGVDISPSTENLNFRCERNDLISLVKLVENSNVDNLRVYINQRDMLYQMLFRYPKIPQL